MTWGIKFLIIIAILFIFFISGQKISFCLGLTGIIGLLLFTNTATLQAIGLIAWNQVKSFELTAVPMFIFMGEIVVLCGLSDSFYKSAAVWFTKMPGGFLQTNIFACAVFAAISGSSIATAAAIGSVAYPEQLKMNYNKRMIVGSLAGGGALGILIPPSLTLLIYGALTQESVAKLFIAGIIPGLIAVAIFMVYIYIRCKINPNLAPITGEKVSAAEKLRSIRGMVPFVILIFVILGGIYMGFTTPTEAAAISVLLATGLSALYKGLTLKKFVKAATNAIKSSCMIFFIVIGAQILSYFIVRSDISRDLTRMVVQADPSKFIFFALIILIYLILGCLMDGTSIVYLTIPVLFPLLQNMQVDTIWFGVLLVILVEIAMLTPPVGMNLFVLHGIVGESSTLKDIIIGTFPFILLYGVLIILLFMFPQMATWLPSTM